jgi:hypothetical protein
MRRCHRLTQLHAPLIQTNNQQAEESRPPPFPSDTSFASSSDAWADRSLDFNLLGRLQAPRNAERQHGRMPRRHSKQQPITLLSVSPPPSAGRKRQERNLPLKSRKPNRSLGHIAHVPKANAARQEHGERHEAAEPKRHGQGIGGQGGEFVRETRESGGHDDDVGEGEEGVYGGEDEEVELDGGPFVPVVGPPG